MANVWQNRISGHGEAAPDQLLANPANWRIHTKVQQEALGALIEEVGLVQSIIVNETTGHVVDGHLRVELALKRNEPLIPVTYVRLTLEEEQKVLALFDPLGALAARDHDKLSTLLTTIETQQESLKTLLSALATDSGTTNVAFQAAPADAPRCPTCGHKLKKGQVLPSEAQV